MSDRKRVKYIKDSFITEKEYQVYRKYKEIGTITGTADKLGIYASSVSDFVKSVEEKVRRAKNTVDVGKELGVK
jgi:transcriptional regulator